ncbi:uncharacterized protein PAC_19034 [Phialocephala subalpina]|uniref:Phytanoyl-CoA dioxygenase n=1 Tax=Phialocephala subalpina TaxID=576137 RepID=A0A1L7XVP9_9HELO|nr:uncharacterized protein PAC_19034 [Phialocephala subalpina]
MSPAARIETFGDFRDDLARDGFAVVKGALSREKTAEVVEKFYTYLEDFNLGFNRYDLSTIKRSKLPYINEKGMMIHYGSAHEDLSGKFPHQDQDPDKPGFRCLQGLVNLQPCGPDDGGLIVCKGAHLLSEQFHEDMKYEKRIPQWNPEWYGFTDVGMAWLVDHGCTWEKVCADPGDLILWDSRTPHYNKSPENGSTQDRMAVYTCYMPVAEASQDDLIKKKDAWDRKVGTSHWPNAQFVGSNKAMRGEDLNGVERAEPVNPAVLSERAFKLTGVPYIKSKT